MSAHQLPGFRYVKPLGQGAHGEVHSAYEDSADRWVAVKVLSAKVTGKAAKGRFERECAALDGLSVHPHVVTIHDHGIMAGGQPYLTMELYPEGSLAEAVKLQGQLPVGDVLRLGVALAGALETAHRAGVVHRAIKPSNVLLAGTDQPALSDFALPLVEEQQAKRAAADESAPTPLHVAPEVLDGKPATPASDVYSLASTLYTALSGKTPVGKRDVPMLSRSDVPGSLRAVLGAAMSRTPGQRPPSALALSAVLQHAQRELGLTVTEPEVLDLPSVAAPDAATADAPAARAAESNGEMLPRLTTRTSTRPTGPPPKRPVSKEFSEPSLDQLVALGQALMDTPKAEAPATPEPGLRKPPPAPLRRRPDEPAAAPLTARRRPSPAAPEEQPAEPLTARPPATTERPAADTPPPLTARQPAAPTTPEAPEPEPETPTAPDPSEPPARRIVDAAPLVIEPEPPAPVKPAVPAASVTEAAPPSAPPAPPAPTPPAPPQQEQLPAWVTGGRGPVVEDDRDDTAERPLPRHYQPPERPHTPVSSGQNFPEPAAGRAGVALPVLAAVAVTVAIAVLVWALALQPDDDGAAPDDPGDTTTTTLQVPSGISAVESQAGVQLEWEGPDTAVYAILLMSETELPETIPAEEGSALLIPSSSLRDDDGYCFAVAYLASLNEVDDVTEAFSPPTCIRGATEETIRTQ